MPLWVHAWFWGLVAGCALLIGAAIGYYAKVSKRIIAGIMAFGSGVLISTLAFELIDEAFKTGGFDAIIVGFLGGALLFTIANVALARYGAKYRKHSDEHHASDGSGTAIAIGALIDGIPESIVIGVSLIPGGPVGWVTVAAVFLSNVPEALSSSAGMKRFGRSRLYTFGIWATIAVISSLASLFGFVFFRHYSPDVIAATTAVAAGGILAMLVDTMIPEAFEEAHEYAGLITVLGFLLAFILTKMSE